MPIQPEELIAAMMPEVHSTPPSREAVHLSLASEVLQSFGELSFAARGGSMLPSILPGDTLLVRRQLVASMRAGQVVLCRRDGAFCAHRVKLKTHCDGRWFLRTSGDALSGEDFPVSEEDVLGRVFGVVRRGKYIDLTESRGLGIRLVGWAVKRSAVFAGLLLRCHALRLRVVGRIGGAERKLGECL